MICVINELFRVLNFNKYVINQNISSNYGYFGSLLFVLL